MTTLEQVNLKTVVDDLFLVLNEKEREVVTRRFSLNDRPKQTLESIGQHFNVTRERIRQIENIALLKLRRHVSHSQLRIVNKTAKSFLEKNGGLMTESDLIASVLNSLGKTTSLDGSIVVLSLSIDEELSKNERSGNMKPAWRFDRISLAMIKTINDHTFKYIKRSKKPIKFSEIYQHIQKQNLFKDMHPTAECIKSSISLDERLVEVREGWGLMEWRSINPKSIRDKALIILQKEKRPMHFIDIANKISEVGIRHKTVTVQAVHNELIRYSEFVLVGRGLYALKDWGYESGTVADVIAAILKEKGPMSKKDIIREVQKQREVQIGTISLNLQKNDVFVRIGRAVYDHIDNVQEG